MLWLKNKKGYWLNPVYLGENWYITELTTFFGNDSMNRQDVQLNIAKAFKVPQDAFELRAWRCAMGTMPGETDFFDAFCCDIFFKHIVHLADPHKYDYFTTEQPNGVIYYADGNVSHEP
jgi:hypothetical protein